MFNIIFTAFEISFNRRNKKKYLWTATLYGYTKYALMCEFFLSVPRAVNTGMYRKSINSGMLQDGG